MGSSPGPGHSTNACGYFWWLQVCQSKRLGCHAIYMLLQCNLYWWKRHVSHQTWPLGSLHASKKECRWEIHSRFETHVEGPKQEQSVVPQNGPWSNKFFKKRRKHIVCISLRKVPFQPESSLDIVKTWFRLLESKEIITCLGSYFCMRTSNCGQYGLKSLNFLFQNAIIRN